MRHNQVLALSACNAQARQGLRASRDKIPKLVANATDGAFVHPVEVAFGRPFTFGQIRRTMVVHVSVGDESRTISRKFRQEHLANLIGCVAMRKTSERVDTTSERHENSGHFL